MVLSTPTGMAKNGEQDRPRLIVQPDDGAEPVLGLIAGARHSLRTVQFTLDDPRFVHAIIDAHRRRVAVHVLLNPQKSSGERGNDDTFERLSHAGVAVEWTHPLSGDAREGARGRRARAVATFGLGPRHFGETRDHALLIEDPAQVRAIAEALPGHQHRKPYRPREGHLACLSQTTRAS
jgi:phosphatidylserine/phosphatidylglycerophosphate/cardiolipin synthase-like enzyme